MLGNSKDAVRAFPADARFSAGYQLERLQRGDGPDDWKPMAAVGAGVREIRVREASGAFRVIYLATMQDCVLVLHAFQKKSRATPHRDIELAAQRLKRWKAAQ
ncbi:type II toxin-antitoxin system RelE/ParE family toxin [Tardiphaga alba]|uniref:Type II toxin-antitoxin system RelE/ParE family toxin n=1 Tax=Tardiphaga alba TaxID=340268 RepID=A0ABX8A8C8_9BRAD|nr:type II toxin-antitoxin system RelE/ParE family toxin [Tardiphaga alba]QUS39502.1 type II toxin-antitoxin system RelE/ParE family toxin [Tardiphaga alba]